MPGFQHKMLRISVRNIQRTLSFEPDWIPRIRKILDTSSKALFVPKGVKVKTLTIGNIPAEWLLPEGADKDKVILYLHGGGYAVGSIQTHRSLAARIAQLAGMKSLIIDYRLAPEHPFPAALEDAIFAYKWLLSQGYDPGHIVIAGDSAGGGLTMATLLGLREMEIPLPAAAVCLSPWVDLTFGSVSAIQQQSNDPIVRVADVREWGKLYAGEHDVKHPLISPLFADLKGLPPVLIQASEHEVLTDDARRLARRIRKAGGLVFSQYWPGVLHVWQLFWRVVPEADEATRNIAAFVREHAQIGLSIIPEKKKVSDNKILNTEETEK